MKNFCYFTPNFLKWMFGIGLILLIFEIGPQIIYNVNSSCWENWEIFLFNILFPGIGLFFILTPIYNYIYAIPYLKKEEQRLIKLIYTLQELENLKDFFIELENNYPDLSEKEIDIRENNSEYFNRIEFNILISWIKLRQYYDILTYIKICVEELYYSDLTVSEIKYIDYLKTRVNGVLHLFEQISIKTMDDIKPGTKINGEIIYWVEDLLHALYRNYSGVNDNAKINIMLVKYKKLNKFHFRN